LKTVTHAIVSQSKLSVATQDSVTQLVTDIARDTAKAVADANLQKEITNVAILTLNEAVQDLQELVVTVIQTKT
jgi:hypothetical protein